MLFTSRHTQRQALPQRPVVAVIMKALLQHISKHLPFIFVQIQLMKIT